MLLKFSAVIGTGNTTAMGANSSSQSQIVSQMTGTNSGTILTQSVNSQQNATGIGTGNTGALVNGSAVLVQNGQVSPYSKCGDDNGSVCTFSN